MFLRFSRISKESLGGICGSVLLLLLLMIPAMAPAQGYFGTVSGVLADSSGAVIPGAKVTLVDQEKGFRFSATSDSGGRYLFRSVPPGVYTVTAEMAGFAKTERTNITVNVGENPTADLSLRVAGSTQTVEVHSQDQHLHVEDATTGAVINRKFINDLPLVDRYVMDLASLTPGVTEADDQCPTGCTGTNFVSNGSRNATADILMDGASITNYEPNGGVTQATYTPSPEAVDEFRVEQSNFSAEYGFSGGSVVNMVTRSGSNNFHGSAYDFIRNTLTDSNNWFNNQSGIPLPPVHRNNFGGTIGGPILKNKTVFFFDYDGTRQSSASTYQAGVPSDAERAGDFGELCAAQGGSFDGSGMCSVAAGQLWDPYTGVYVANDQGAGAVRSGFIPFNNIAAYTSPGNPNLDGTPYQLGGGAGNLIDPVAQRLMQLFPEPTANMASPTIYDNWIASGATRNPNDQWDLKIDQRFSQKNLLSARYSHAWNSVVPYNCFGNFADPCAGGPNHGSAHVFTLNDTHTFSPTLLLTGTLGFTRGAERISAYNGEGGVTDPLSKLGFPGYLNSNGFMGVPAIFIDQSSYYSAGYTSIGGDPYGNYKQGQDTGQLTITVNKVIGGTDLKFGFEGRLHQMNYIQTNAPNGIFSFDRSGSSQCPYDFGTCGGDGMASFLMGQMSAGGDAGTYYEIQDQPATEDHQYAWYVQDNWKATKKLTLNLGLRYDVSMPRTDRHNRQNWFDPNIPLPLSVPGFGTLHGGEVFASSSQRTIVNGDWKDIQPRFGFAYRMWRLTVIRGGYGIYYSQPRSGATGVAPYGAQGFNQYTSAIVTYNNDGATPYLHLSNPYPNGLIKPPGNSLGVMNDVGFGANGPLRNMTNTPYEQSWSFGVEHQFPWNVMFDAMYAGKKGTHLYFSGANYINHLGPQIESYTPDQINNLTNYVDNPFASVITDPNSPLSSPQIQELYLELPYPQFPNGVATDAWPIASSIYHSMQVVAEKRYSNGLQFLASWVWSKSIDDSSVPDDNTTWLGSFTSLQDPNKPWLERSLSTFDIPNVFQFSYTWELPIGRGRALLSNMPRALDAIVGGWKTTGVWRVAGGRPLAFSTYDGTPLPTYGAQRPNMVAKPKRTGGKDSVWINQYIANPDALQLPPVYTLGDAPRATGAIRTPTAFNSNMAIDKDFSLAGIREGMRLELRLEAENALNHPVFGTPNTSVDDPNFGVISYTSNTPRQVQLGAKIVF